VDPVRATPAEIERVAEIFDLGPALTAPVVAARGQQGVVWRLETDRGAFAVKELLDPVTEQQVATDVLLTTEMVRRGVHAPKPLRDSDGRALATVGKVVLRAYTWVDLEPPRTDLDPERIGALLAMLHRDPIPVDGQQVDPWYTEPVPVQEWQQTADALGAAAAPFAAEFVESVPQCCSMQELFRAPGPTQLCHCDLWADNLRLSQDGRLCVIDWDNCGAAEPAQELAMPLFDFCSGDPDRAAALYRAYRRGGGPGRLTDPSDFTMVLAQFGHFALAAGQQWLEATDDGERARAEAWFREGWDRPLDRRGIDLLLTALRHA
jgi:Ser/Thr protein kinase RdoA (MazF antagonist)